MAEALTMKERLDQMIHELDPEVESLVKFVIEQEKDNMNEKYARVKEEIRKHIDKTVQSQVNSAK